jgi:hypothetical protein
MYQGWLLSIGLGQIPSRLETVAQVAETEGKRASTWNSSVVSMARLLLNKKSLTTNSMDGSL